MSDERAGRTQGSSRSARQSSGRGVRLRRLIEHYNALYTPQVREIEREAMTYAARTDFAGMLKFLALKQEDRGTGAGNQYGGWWRLQATMLADPANRPLRAYLDWLRRTRAYYWSEPEVLAGEEHIEAFLNSDRGSARS